ncbi:hypothetical protein CPB86DRAFT_754796 [Serendipita vermifera]|nr:hypothetical protein CPB86DRAFT_754796 [Serendipita vermifera]
MATRRKAIASLKDLKPTEKVPLPMFLKLLNDAGMSMANAIALAGKVYKAFNTPQKLATLNVADLARLGIDDKERRKEFMNAVSEFKQLDSKAPFIDNTPSDPEQTLLSVSGVAWAEGDSGTTLDNLDVEEVKSREEETVKQQKEEELERRQTKALDIDEKRRAALRAFEENLKKNKVSDKKRKRGRDDDLLNDPFAPPSISRTDPFSASYTGGYKFNEILDEDNLNTKVVKINRAPVMMAWSCIVAEKLGFEREEALSIAGAYTEMNATTKGANLGIYDKSKEKGMEPGMGTAQPHVELMGRRIPLFQTENGQWRALMKGEPVLPSKAFSYITRALAQMSPYMLGALFLLANSYEDPQRLNQKGYSLYCTFRPEGGGWGLRGDLKLSTILNLRLKEGQPLDISTSQDGVDIKDDGITAEYNDGPEKKKRKIDETDTFEDFEAMEGAEDFTIWDLYEE